MMLTYRTRACVVHCAVATAGAGPLLPAPAAVAPPPPAWLRVSPPRLEQPHVSRSHSSGTSLRQPARISSMNRNDVDDGGAATDPGSVAPEQAKYMPLAFPGVAVAGPGGAVAGGKLRRSCSDGSLPLLLDGSSSVQAGAPMGKRQKMEADLGPRTAAALPPARTPGLPPLPTVLLLLSQLERQLAQIQVSTYLSVAGCQ